VERERVAGIGAEGNGNAGIVDPFEVRQRLAKVRAVRAVRSSSAAALGR